MGGLGKDSAQANDVFSVADSCLRAPGEEGRTSSPRPVGNRATLAQETVTVLAAHLRSDNARGQSVPVNLTALVPLRHCPPGLPVGGLSADPWRPSGGRDARRGAREPGGTCERPSAGTRTAPAWPASWASPRQGLSKLMALLHIDRFDRSHDSVQGPSKSRTTAVSFAEPSRRSRSAGRHVEIC